MFFFLTTFPSLKHGLEACPFSAGQGAGSRRSLGWLRVFSWLGAVL